MSKAWTGSSTPSSSASTWNGKTAPSRFLHKQLDVTSILISFVSGVRPGLVFAPTGAASTDIYGREGKRFQHCFGASLISSDLIGLVAPDEGQIAHITLWDASSFWRSRGR